MLVDAARAWPHRPLTSVGYRYARYAGGGSKPVRVGTLRSGSEIELDLSQWQHLEIFFHGTLDEPVTALLRNMARPGWTFFDVGANEGYYAFLAADLGGSGSKVVAFEPQAAVASLLRASVNRNRTPVTVVEAACVAEGESITFYASDDRTNLGAGTVVPGLHKGEGTSVRAVTLDKYCTDSGLVPDIVKIDVEGFELYVLRGFTETLAARPPALILAEITDDARFPSHREVEGFLAGFGYEAHRVGSEGELLPFDAPCGLENIAFMLRS